MNIPLKMAEPQMPSKTELCEHEFEDLYYRLDLVNSVGTSSVYVCLGEEYKPKRLVYCKKCGQVFIKEFEEEGK